jgi:hypothetical protein
VVVVDEEGGGEAGEDSGSDVEVEVISSYKLLHKKPV